MPDDAEGGDCGGQVVLVDVGGGPPSEARGRVVGAQEGEVEYAGGAAVDPVDDVVGVAPLWWSPAAGEGAAFVPDPEGGLHGLGDQAFEPADVQWLAFAAQDYGDD